MEKVKKTRVSHLNLDSSKRMIFMSDIHGDVKLFKDSLAGVNFSNDDYLFVIGDLIEKGDLGDNLKMLDYLIELNQEDNVFLMAGNCDEVFRFILPPVDEKKFLYYALDKKKSVINDFASKIGYSLSSNMNVSSFVDLFIKENQKYYDFIDGLDDVIFINDKLVLVHGGIIDINNIPNNSIDVLKFDRFLDSSNVQEKIMIVGHYPTRNYRSKEFNVDPIFDFTKNIICIDGGNNVVKGGQINVVILDSLASMNFSFKAFDHYPKYIMKKDVYYETPKLQFKMMFGNNEITIIKEDLDYYYIGTINDEKMWVHKSLVYNKNNKFYCYDCSNSFISLRKGDEISIIIAGKPYTLIKHKGNIGLIESFYIYEA